MTPDELLTTNLVTTHDVAAVLPPGKPDVPMASLTPKVVQDRFVSAIDDSKTPVASIEPVTSRPTKTAEATVPTGGAAVTPAR